MIRRLLLLTLLSLGIEGVAFSQPLSEQELHRLDPRLRAVVPEAWLAKAPSKAPAPPAVYEGADGENRYGVIVYSDNPAAVRAGGIDVNSEHASFVTALVTSEDLVRLSRARSVRYVDAGEERYPANDVAAALVGATLLHDGVLSGTPYHGAGVIVCVLDSGIDFTHRDFRDPVDDTKSRILYIWDQTLNPTGGESSPGEGCCGYGVEYTKVHIENEIDGTPAGFVRQKDGNGHGTHVTGTAAGNGSSFSPARHVGMAPKADIVFIKAGSGSFPETRIIEGFDYCDAKAEAESKSAVMNLSLGSKAGSHDGTDPESVAADAFASGPGRMAVYAAGNSGDDLIHTSGSVAPAATVTISFTVTAYAPESGGNNDDMGLEVWFDGAGSVEATVTTPSGHSAIIEPGESKTVSTSDADVFGQNDVSVANGNRYVSIDISDGSGIEVATGLWTVDVRNSSGGPMDYHAWLVDDDLGDPLIEMTLAGGDSDYTLTTNATNPLIVGSYVHLWQWCDHDGDCWSYGSTNRSDDISSFSSGGPTRDGRFKPDIAAPGQGMISTLSRDAGFSPGSRYYMEDGAHRLNFGTSMATAVVSGSVALLFEADPTLTASEVLSTITGTADADNFTGAVWNSRWGYGKLNTFRAMAEVLGAAGTAQREILVYDQWGSDSSTEVASGVKAAVRFTPTVSGEAVGMFFYTSPTINLTGALAAEVWSDDGSGLPEAKLGSTVHHDHTLIRPLSWNYVDLTGTGVSVSAGTDYHVVLRALQAGDNLFVRTDTDAGTFDGRSTMHNGTGWVKRGFDIRMRAVVAAGIISLPIELISLQAVADENAILVSWETAREEEKPGWGVQLKSADTFEEVAFVSGGEATAGRRSYTHRITDVAPGIHVVRLRQVDADGAVTFSPETEVRVGFSGSYFVSAPYPNPFHQRTGVRLVVPTRQHVRVEVYDALGRGVRTLIDDQLESSVTTIIEFDGTDLPSGLYLLRTAGERFSVTRKVMLVK